MPCDDHDDDSGGTGVFSSPPSFLHQVNPEYACIAPLTDAERRRAILNWRKGERSRLLDERQAIASDKRAEWSHAITEQLDALLGDVRGRTISLYWPIRGEPNLRAWAADLTKRGAICALPLVVEKNAPLVFRSWKPGEPLVKGFWNIPVPEHGLEVVPDVSLAPVVGHDEQGYRLGYGGGYFDRTLAAIAPRPFVIGVGYAQAAIRTIYPLPHDIMLNAVVTEEGTRRFARWSSFKVFAKPK
jgi:5-formyltetrahydrofolate cyclo-ligase